MDIYSSEIKVIAAILLPEVVFETLDYFFFNIAYKEFELYVVDLMMTHSPILYLYNRRYLVVLDNATSKEILI